MRFKYNGENYTVIFMNRVNPRGFVKASTKGGSSKLWIIPEPGSMNLRPYKLLIKKGDGTNVVKKRTLAVTGTERSTSRSPAPKIKKGKSSKSRSPSPKKKKKRSSKSRSKSRSTSRESRKKKKKGSSSPRKKKKSSSRSPKRSESPSKNNEKNNVKETEKENEKMDYYSPVVVEFNFRRENTVRRTSKRTKSKSKNGRKKSKDGRKPRRKKAKGEPKNPRSAYIYWVMEERPKLRKKNSKVKFLFNKKTKFIFS